MEKTAEQNCWNITCHNKQLLHLLHYMPADVQQGELKNNLWLERAIHRDIFVEFLHVFLTVVNAINASGGDTCYSFGQLKGQKSNE